MSERKSRKRGGRAKYRGISNHQICVLVFARDRQKMTFSGVLGEISKSFIWVKKNWLGYRVIADGTGP
jgi:hypothetical protein